MVATSLPFWMQHTGRTMMPFLADPSSRERLPARRGPAATAAAGAIVVELCQPSAVEHHRDDWAALAARAIEPNVFMEPGFALPAALHFPPAQRPAFLLCWDMGGETAPTLIGLLALEAPRHGAAATWSHAQWVASAPLLDAARGAVALDAMLGWLAADRRACAGLVLRGIVAGGPLMRLLKDGGRREVAVLDSRARAILTQAQAPDDGPAAKRLKELRRQGRRLGTSALRSASGAEAVRAATERFLELEARGWKGRRGTALLNDAHLATFTRAMTRLMAAEGRCRIDMLEVAGEPVAMGIVLQSQDRAFYWKTAFDERHARHSPGKQLALAIGERQRADDTVALTDSCAVPDHPMIDGLWTGRMEVLDVLVAGPGGDGGRFARAAFRLRTAAAARRAAKATVLALRKGLSGRR